MKITLILLFTVAITALLSCENSEDNFTTQQNKANWIKEAFSTLESGKYPRIKAISWWHENFDKSELKVNSSQESLRAYREGVNSSTFVTKPLFSSNKLIAPSVGIYHAAYPDFGGTEDIVASSKIYNYESLVNKDITWAYFSNNWYDSITFPKDEIDSIISCKKLPFIRMMARTEFSEGKADKNYTMQKIIDGEFDIELTKWAQDAKACDAPLLVEFGTEVNGNWFPWNGEYNGAGTKDLYGKQNEFDGAERFRDAYRHIIDIFRSERVDNITWFFHVDAYSEPEVDWNRFELYYPGDDYIDWLGVSIYGPQERGDEYQDFSEILADIYPRLVSLSNKPIAILEFAITEI